MQQQRRFLRSVVMAPGMDVREVMEAMYKAGCDRCREMFNRLPLANRLPPAGVSTSALSLQGNGKKY